MLVTKIIKITQSRILSRKVAECAREADAVYDMTIMMKLVHPEITQFDINNLITAWRREFGLASTYHMHEAAAKDAFQAVIRFRKSNRLKRAKRVWRKKQIRLGKKERCRHNRWTEPSSLMRWWGKKITRLRSLKSRGTPKLRGGGAIFLPELGEVRPRTKIPQCRPRSQMIDTTRKVTRRTRDPDREFKLHLQIEVPDPKPAAGPHGGTRSRSTPPGSSHRRARR